jgi:hypothetical protein
VLRKLLAATALAGLATSGVALASAPAPQAIKAVTSAVEDIAVQVAPEVPSNSKVRVLKNNADCGGAGFSKITVPLSKRGFMCVHTAADVIPSQGEALKAAAPAAAQKAPATAKITCYGDGTTGSRIQMIYGYHDGLPNRAKTVVDQIRRVYAPRIQAVIKNQSGGKDLGMRFAFTKGCKAIDVLVVKFPRSVQYATDPRDPNGQLGRAANVLAAMGHNRADRKYHILWDGWNVPACGIGELLPIDPVTSLPYAPTGQGLPTVGARTDADVADLLAGNLVSTYSMTFNHAGGQRGPTCFTGRGLSGVATQIHEIFHTLGAVQLDAPHADTGHCTDAPSIMCSGGAEGYGLGVQIKVCARVLVETLDCGMDDYWSPGPTADTYLFSHYNIAKTPFFGPQPQDNLAASPL